MFSSSVNASHLFGNVKLFADCSENVILFTSLKKGKEKLVRVFKVLL